MLKAITFPPERAEAALATVQALVDLSTQQLEMCTQVFEELEFSGELQKDFMKRLVRLQGDVRKARAELKALATAATAGEEP
ncbi:hypothetical protein ASC89_21235 [Devosia sp. Root413D1]|jgi:hypothetical protein|uniref:hypothetical protein n=1 Tax=unclassified Devosia TaxID=196773 RepID=UPI0006F4EB8C|nr:MULTISPECIES: hypothetical protein [unclassified Devosia]KQU95139.1 hypothetical protein ASC68_18460 [Devosia sp. Root105]KQW77684.1 hypothetical protein ASC89_21235 [Devosia sp. Root413D1]